MKYPLIIIPSFLEKPFIDFSKKDAENYLNWFLEIKETRIDILRENIKAVYPNWTADFSLKSFENLNEWLKSIITFRNKTQEEQRLEQLQLSETPLLKDVIESSVYTLSEDTTSICFDVGLYFGESLKKINIGIEWTYKLDPPNYVHYAQPILTKKKSKVDLNPRHIMEITAYKILEGNANDNEIIRLYEVWNTLLK